MGKCQDADRIFKTVATPSNPSHLTEFVLCTLESERCMVRKLEKQTALTVFKTWSAALVSLKLLREYCLLLLLRASCILLSTCQGEKLLKESGVSLAVRYILYEGHLPVQNILGRAYIFLCLMRDELCARGYCPLSHSVWSCFSHSIFTICSCLPVFSCLHWGASF